ncbi:MAG: hypothetical protein ACRDDY_16815 [Clostridium sp.]|uniref:hypothetical protein n=1 Tax=Clostridium sp. TaxID=1506 RepID=UPI003EE5FA3B
MSQIKKELNVMEDRIFIKNGKQYTEEKLTDIWLDDQYTPHQFETWLIKKGYKVISGGADNDK